MSSPSRPCPTWWRTKRNSCCSCSSSCSSLPREGLDGGQPLSSLLGAPSLASGGRNGHNQQVDSLEQEDQRERPRERRGSGGKAHTHSLTPRRSLSQGNGLLGGHGKQQTGGGGRATPCPLLSRAEARVRRRRRRPSWSVLGGRENNPPWSGQGGGGGWKPLSASLPSLPPASGKGRRHSRTGRGGAGV